MATAICPICKTQKMRFGGMAALDGTFCGKCYDRALAKGINSSKFSKLYLSEIKEYIEEVKAEDTQKWVDGIEKQRETMAKDRESKLPYLEAFRKSVYEFFSGKRIEENASLQNYATQIFWHVNLLRKMRLAERRIEVKEEAQHVKIESLDDFSKRVFFDGKYEISQITETIDGAVSFQRDDKTIYEKKKYNIAQYILQNVHKTDNDDIVCPNCGAVSSRSNLIDGCDYCGSMFTVEDLADRVAEYHMKRSIDVGSTAFIYTDKGDKAGTIISAIVLFLIGLRLGLIHSILSAIVFLVLSPILGFLAYYAIFKLSIVIFNVFRSNHQTTQEFRREAERRNEEMMEKIRSYDPLFTSEELYAEAGNMITAHYYASSPREVTAFWEDANEKAIKAILDDNKDVINAEQLSISIRDYHVENGYQHITVAAELEILEDKEKKVSVRNDDLLVKLTKSADCKTQAVNRPKMLACPSCGSSISFMEGCRCHYCGGGLKLSDIGWALTSMEKQ